MLARVRHVRSLRRRFCRADRICQADASGDAARRRRERGLDLSLQLAGGPPAAHRLGSVFGGVGAGDLGEIGAVLEPPYAVCSLSRSCGGGLGWGPSPRTLTVIRQQRQAKIALASRQSPFRESPHPNPPPQVRERGWLRRAACRIRRDLPFSA